MTFTPIANGLEPWGDAVNNGILDVQNQAVNANAAAAAAQTTANSAQVTASAAVPKDALFLNVKDHGIVGDGVTDNGAALTALLASVPSTGAVVYFPVGNYATSQALVPKPGTVLLGFNKHGLYTNSGTLGTATVISALGTFSGTALLNLDGSSTAVHDVTVSGLLFNGASAPGTTQGCFINGASTDLVLSNVSFSHFPGTGITMAVAGGNTPSGYFERVTSWFSGVHGFNLALQDSTFFACMAFQATQNNWNITSANDVVFNSCRSEHATQYGYLLTLTSATSTIVFNSCTTDQNNWDGFRVDGSSGNGPIQLNGCSFRRDGNNAGAGSTQYAGVTVNNSTIPVILDGVNVSPMRGDTAGYGPYYGLNVATSSFVRATGGYYGCVSTGLPFNYDGNGSLLIGGGILTGSNNQTGFPGTTSASSIFAVAGNTNPRVANSMIAWNVDPFIAAQSQSLNTNGTLYLNAVFVDNPSITSKAFLWIGTAGSGATAGQNFVGLYDSNGNLVASVGADTLTTQAAGLYTATWTTPKLLQPGMYWVAVLTNSTTAPQLFRSGNAMIPAMNANVGSSRFRVATNGTGLTALPGTITPSSNSQTAPLPFWVAIA